MFSGFSKNKTHYEKGQVFPFLIAIMVVIIILAMVVVNLGQLGVFKTDTSNAADAGALAGASVLSQTLLGFGLKSDMMAGAGVIAIAYIFTVLAAYDPLVGIIFAISIFITHDIEMITEYLMALYEGKMGWANAKKTALQYAFSNAGVDEPRISFSASGADWQSYQKMESDRLKSGFSRFMDHPCSGYAAAVGEIGPDFNISAEFNVSSGYGWTQAPDSRINNSYDDYGPYPTDCGDASVIADTTYDPRYENYDNWVKVEVSGGIFYPLALLSFKDYFVGITETLSVAVFAVVFCKTYAYYSGLGVLAVIPAAFFGLLAAEIFKAFLDMVPVGLKMTDEGTQTDENPLTVKVTRYKRDMDAGMWNFTYGRVSSEASSRAFREYGDANTIKPTILSTSANVASGEAGNYDGDFDVSDLSTEFIIFIIADVIVTALLCIFLFPWGILIAFLLNILFASLDLVPDAYDDTDISYSYDGTDLSGAFNTKRHLFETELIYVK